MLDWSKKGVLKLLTGLPIQLFCFRTKLKFRDTFWIRYNVESKTRLSVAFLRKNTQQILLPVQFHFLQIIDTFSELMHDVCYDIELEPSLQLVEGESFFNKSTCTYDNAGLDTKKTVSGVQIQ